MSSLPPPSKCCISPSCLEVTPGVHHAAASAPLPAMARCVSADAVDEPPSCLAGTLPASAGDSKDLVESTPTSWPATSSRSACESQSLLHQALQRPRRPPLSDPGKVAIDQIADRGGLGMASNALLKLASTFFGTQAVSRLAERHMRAASRPVPQPVAATAPTQESPGESRKSRSVPIPGHDAWQNEVGVPDIYARDVVWPSQTVAQVVGATMSKIVAERASLSLNPLFARWIGDDVGSWVGRAFADYCPPEDAARVAIECQIRHWERETKKLVLVVGVNIFCDGERRNLESQPITYQLP